LLEQHSGRVFTTKKGADGLFEGSAEKHGGTRVLLLPTVEIAVPVSARTAKVLADLGVGISHCDASAVLEREGLETGRCAEFEICLGHNTWHGSQGRTRGITRRTNDWCS
jgi:hypothetical protein